jgi:mRNA interferase MazF
MAYRSFYCPDRGDIIHFNCNPSAGHEMASYHFGLVMSPKSYNRASGLCVVLIATSKKKGYPYELDLPVGLIPQNPKRPCDDSVLLCDQIRNIDFRERNLEFKAKASAEMVERALDMLLTLLDPLLME